MTYVVTGNVASAARHERVGDDQAGQRIDNFLIRHCPGVPRSHIYRLIRKGSVLVDGKRVKQTRKLVAGEQVRIPALEQKAAEQISVPNRLASAVGQSVLFEHDDFLIINKPAGIAVHGGSGLAFGLIDALRQHRKDPRLELAHRLDRATSGCLMVGRGMQATRRLQNLFRNRQITKRYLALVDGQWPQSVTRIDAPLMKNVEHAGERRVMVSSEGQTALTHVRVTERFSEATMLEVTLDTGRTHQIRVHTRHIGHAVVGDERYGKNHSNARFRKAGLSRLYLHACSLAFEWGGCPVMVEAIPDAPWKRSLNTLRTR